MNGTEIFRELNKIHSQIQNDEVYQRNRALDAYKKQEIKSENNQLTEIKNLINENNNGNS